MPTALPKARGHAGQHQARLYALAHLVWTEVHKTHGPRSDSQIAVWLMEMDRIVQRRKELEPRHERLREQQRARRAAARAQGLAWT